MSRSEGWADEIVLMTEWGGDGEIDLGVRGRDGQIREGMSKARCERSDGRRSRGNILERLTTLSGNPVVVDEETRPYGNGGARRKVE
jgi:hypothetical protein